MPQFSLDLSFRVEILWIQMPKLICQVQIGFCVNKKYFVMFRSQIMHNFVSDKVQFPLIQISNLRLYICTLYKLSYFLHFFPKYRKCLIFNPYTFFTLKIFQIQFKTIFKKYLYIIIKVFT